MKASSLCIGQILCNFVAYSRTMKRFLSLYAIASLMSFSGQAQSFNYIPSAHMQDTVETKAYSTMYMNIVTLDSSGVQLKWRVVSNTLAQDWSISLCDYPNCYTTVPDSALMNSVSAAELQGGLNPFFQLLTGTKDDELTGVIELYVFDATDESKGDTVSFSVTTVAPLEDTTGASGITTLRANEQISVFPNPAQSIATVSAIQLQQVQLLDVSGALIQTIQSLGDENIDLDITTLSPGSYMIISTTATGIHHTKLIKQ